MILAGFSPRYWLLFLGKTVPNSFVLWLSVLELDSTGHSFLQPFTDQKLSRQLISAMKALRHLQSINDFTMCSLVRKNVSMHTYVIKSL